LPRRLPSFAREVKHRAALAAVACLALAAASLLTPSAPTTDPWGWIVWGREVAHLDLSTAVLGAPSWKPLPVLATAPLSLFGGAAPDLWLLVARAAGLLGLVAAYRCGCRLSGRAAGVLAAVGLALSVEWMRSWMHGYAEPLAIALLLFAADRHWSAKPRQALLLLAGVGLVRPEAFALVLLYGVLMWRRGALPLVALAAAAVIVPALWIVPDWLGSDELFHASRVSSAVEPKGVHAALVALAGGAGIAPVPLSLTAVAGLALAYRTRDRRVLELSAVALGWTGLLFAMMLTGYPASARFFVLPASLVCVLGGAGAVRIVELARTAPSRFQTALVLALLALPAVVIRADGVGDEVGASVKRARVEQALARVIDRAGPSRLRACGTPVLPEGMGWLRGDVAWRLDLPIRRVRAVNTSGDRYIERLSDDGVEPGVHSEDITIRTHRHRIVLIDPFAHMRVRLVSPRSDLDVASRAGTWRVLVPDSAGCNAFTRDA
jgi:hypothetical protein